MSRHDQAGPGGRTPGPHPEGLREDLDRHGGPEAHGGPELGFGPICGGPGIRSQHPGSPGPKHGVDQRPQGGFLPGGLRVYSPAGRPDGIGDRRQGRRRPGREAGTPLEGQDCGLRRGASHLILFWHEISAGADQGVGPNYLVDTRVRYCRTFCRTF
jgi:hypothetical protein